MAKSSAHVGTYRASRQRPELAEKTSWGRW